MIPLSQTDTMKRTRGLGHRHLKYLLGILLATPEMLLLESIGNSVARVGFRKGIQHFSLSTVVNQLHSELGDTI